MGLRFKSALCRGIVETITGAVKHSAMGPTLHIAHGLGDRAQMACNRTANVIPEGVNASNHENAHATKTHLSPGPRRRTRVINTLDPKTLRNCTSHTGLPGWRRSARHWTKFPLTPTPTASIVGIPVIRLWNVHCIIHDGMAVVIKIAKGLLISHHKIVVHNVQGHHSEPRRRSNEGRRNGRRLQSARGRRTGQEHLTAKGPDLATVAGRVPWRRICATHVASTGIGKTRVPNHHQQVGF